MINYKSAEILKLIILVTLWASAYSLGKVALTTMSPIAIVFTRLFSGTVFMALIILITKVKIPPITNYKTWFSMGMIGIVGSLLPFFLITEAQTNVPSSLASIYLSITPLFAALLAYIFIPNEKITKVKFFGVILGVLGAILLALPNFSGADFINIAEFKSSIGAQLQLFAAAFCYALAIIIVRIGAPNINPIAMSFGFIFISTIVALPMAFTDIMQNYVNYSMSSIISAILIGIGPTALAGILYVEAVHRVGPLMVANFSNLVPFAALIIGYILFRETLPLSTFLGLGIILAGVYFVQKN